MPLGERALNPDTPIWSTCFLVRERSSISALRMARFAPFKRWTHVRNLVRH